MISPEVLRRFAVFGGLAPADYLDLAMISERMSCPKAECLFEEGNPAEDVFLIIEGSVALKFRHNGQSWVSSEVESVIAGEIIGWSALVEPYEYTMSAITETDTELVKIDGKQLRHQIEQNPELGYPIMKRMAEIIGTRLRNIRVRFVSLTE